MVVVVLVKQQETAAFIVAYISPARRDLARNTIPQLNILYEDDLRNLV